MSTVKYYGKYRGIVVNNVDPEQRGRIMAIVPDIAGLIPGSWALPCVPFAGKQSGVYVVPQVGAGVWMEFEQGDPDFPIWTGGFWGSAAEVPTLAMVGNPVSPSVILASGLLSSISISDVPGPTGGIMIKAISGAMILVNEIGITISNGQGASIVMTGPTVNVNNGALVVT